MFFKVRLSCTIIVTCLFMTGAAAQQITEEQKSKIYLLAQAGNCKEMWDMFWPEAQNNDRVAFSALSGLYLSFGLYPRIEFSKDEKLDPKIALTLAIYGFNSDSPLHQNMISGRLSRYGSSGKAVKTCLLSEKPLSKCIDKAADLGIVPPIDEYISQINSKLKSGYTITCALGHK